MSSSWRDRARGRGWWARWGRARPRPGCRARRAAWDGRARKRESRGRNLRGLLELLGPYRVRVRARCWARSCSARPLRSLRRCSPSRDRQRHRAHDIHTLVAGRRRVPRLRAARVGDDLRPDLPRRLGRTAGARRPAHPHLRAPAEPADRLLREPPRGRADLAHDQRCGGPRKPRDGLGGDAVPVRPHADRRGRRTALPRRQARAADLLRRCRPIAGGSVWFRLTSAGAFRRTRETIGSITAYLQETLSGIRVVRSFGQEPAPHGALRRAQRGQPRGQHDDGAAQRRLLPRRGNALRGSGRG